MEQSNKRRREEITSFDNDINEIEKKLKEVVKEQLSSFECNIQNILTKYNNKIIEFKAFQQQYLSSLEQVEKSYSKFQNRIKLDIGGTVFNTTKETLTKIENTYFYVLITNADNFKANEDGSYFVDRDPSVFGRILNFLRDGKINLEGMTSGMFDLLKKDLDFYCIPPPKELAYPDFLVVRVRVIYKIGKKVQPG